MTAARLKARIWVQAQVRLCDLGGLAITVPRRGDPDAGSIAIKLNRLEQGCVVLVQTRTAEGEPGWMRATGARPVAEAEADAYLRRQVEFDPDLWVVEIEDPKERYVVDGPIVAI